MSTRAAPLVERLDAAEVAEVMPVMTTAFDPAFGEAWTAAQCHGLLTLPGTWLLVARDEDGATTGFALSRVVADEAELLLIAVAPPAARQGVGSALMAATMAEARAQGATLLHLEARDGNGARRLYDRFGFHEVGRRRDYYRGKHGSFDALTLSRDL